MCGNICYNVANHIEPDDNKLNALYNTIYSKSVSALSFVSCIQEFYEYTVLLTENTI